MADVEVESWWFVNKKWHELTRMPTLDKGFEDSFREYLYRKKKFDTISDVKDIGLGLSYSTLSDTSHELDVICREDKGLFIFELKHYEVSEITKEIIFTFLGKVMDFYFKNAESMSTYKITMFLVTINKNIGDSIRKLCITYGIKLIEPSLMTLGTIDYFASDLYQKLQAENSEDIKLKVEDLIENVNELKERYDYSFSDLFRYKDEKIQIELPSLPFNPTETLNKIKDNYCLFETVRETWKSKRS